MPQTPAAPTITGERQSFHQSSPAGRIRHDLSRSAVRNMERRGLPRSVAMQLTGHKTESVYRRYAITSEADLREGVEKLNTGTGIIRRDGRRLRQARRRSE